MERIYTEDINDNGSDCSVDYDNSDDSQDNIAVRLPIRNRGSNVVANSNNTNSSQPPDSYNIKGKNPNGKDESNSGLVIPMNQEYVDPIELSKLAVQPQEKPKEKLKKKTSKKGETLTAEAAIQYMINERRAMDEEQAILRRENFKLREELEKTELGNYSSQSESQGRQGMTLAKGSSNDFEIEKEKLKKEADRLRVENENFRKQFLANEKRLASSINLDNEATQSTSSSRGIGLGLVQRGPLFSPPKHLPVPPLLSQQNKAPPLPLLPLLLWEGGFLWKIPYNGKGEPEKRVVMIKRAAKLARYSQEVKIIGSSNGNHSKVGYGLTHGTSQVMNVDQTHTYISFPPTLLWFSADKIGEGMQNGRELALFEDTQIISGHGTTAFWKLANRKGAALPRHELCFSVVATTRSLDVAAETVSEAEEWKKSLDILLDIFKPISERSEIDIQQNNYSQELLNLGIGEGQSTPPPPPPTHHSKTSPIFRHAPPQVSTPQEEMNALQQEALTKQMFAAANASDNLQLKEVLNHNIPVNIMEPATFDTPLMICVRNGNTEGTQICLDHGARNDPHPDFGQTALHAGVDAGHYDAVLVLMLAAAESQADSIISNLADPSGQTPLHLSSLRGNARILELLLTHGADISRVDDKGQTSLHLTCAAGHKSCLAVLLDHGGDILLEETDNSGNCCLHYAAMYGRLACVRLLLETAAEVMTRNNRGLTPYNLASAKGHHQVGLLLLEYQDSAAAVIKSTPLKTPSKLNTNYDDDDEDDKNKGSNAFTIGIRDEPKLSLKNPYEVSNIALPRPHTSNSPLVNHKSYLNSPITPNAGYHVVSSQRPQTARTSNDNPIYSPNTTNSARERPTPNLFDGMQVHNKPNPFKAKEQGIGSSFNNNNSNSPIILSPNYNNHNQLSPSPSAYVDAYATSQPLNRYPPTPGNESLNDSYNQPFYSPLPHPNHVSKGHSPVYGNYTNDNQQNYVEAHVEEYYEEENDIEFISDIAEAIENFYYDNVSWNSYYTDEGHIYYLDSISGHSQWEDPREVGYVASNDYDENQEIDNNNNNGLFLSSSPTRHSPPPKNNSRILISPKKSQKQINSSNISSDEDSNSDDNEMPLHMITDSKFMNNNSPSKHSKRRNKKSSSSSNTAPNSVQKTKKTSRGLDSSPVVKLNNIPIGLDLGNSSKSSSIKLPLPSIEKNQNMNINQEPPVAVNLFGGDTSDWDTDAAHLQSDWDTDAKRGGIQIRHVNNSNSHNNLNNNLNNNNNNNNSNNNRISEMSEEKENNRYDTDDVGMITETTDGGTTDNQRNIRQIIPQPSQTNPHSIKSKIKLLESKQVYDKPNNIPVSASKNNWMSNSDSKDSKDIKNNNEINEFKGLKVDLSIPTSPIIDSRTNEVILVSSPAKSPFSSKFTDLLDEEKDSNEKNIKEDIKLAKRKTVESKAEVTEEEKISKYIKLLESGMNIRSVRRTMDNECETKELISKVLYLADSVQVKKVPNYDQSDNSSNNNNNIEDVDEEIIEDMQSLKSDPIIGKYAKMYVMGVPLPSIKQKMALDEVDEANSNRILLASGEKLIKSKVIKAIVKIETLDDLRQDPDLIKYVKMVNMGVPHANVRARMQLDSIDIIQINRLFRALGHVIEGEDDKKVPLVESKVNKNTSKKASKEMVKLHWNTISADKIDNTIWASTGDDKEEIKESDMEELEKLFCALPEPKADKDTHSVSLFNKVDKASLKLLVLEGRRAQNIVIALSQYKSFGHYSKLFSAICSLEDMNGTLTIDHIENLIPLLPTLSELKQVKDIMKSKHPAEIFIQNAMDFYPELPRRLNCFVNCHHFQSTCRSISIKAQNLVVTCNEVLSSDKLARVLQKMLAVGNIMNQGTFKGQASGFSLDSLLKMVNTKGIDKKTTVLDYVVKSIIDKGEDRILDVSDDLIMVDQCTKLSGKEILRECEIVEKNYKMLQEELGRCEVQIKEEVIGVNSPNPTSPSQRRSRARHMNGKFKASLEINVNNFKDVLKDVDKSCQLMNRKLNEVLEYFGEDQKTCDTMKIFTVLQQFRLALVQSKLVVERRENSKARNSAKDTI